MGHSLVFGGENPFLIPTKSLQAKTHGALSCCPSRHHPDFGCALQRVGSIFRGETLIEICLLDAWKKLKNILPNGDLPWYNP